MSPSGLYPPPVGTGRPRLTQRGGAPNAANRCAPASAPPHHRQPIDWCERLGHAGVWGKNALSTGRFVGVEKTSAPIAVPAATSSQAISRRLLEVRPRSPFRLDLTAWALRRREQNTIDGWDGRTYRRALLIGRRPIAVAVTQAGTRDASRLDVVISGRQLDSSIDSMAGAALTSLLGLEIDLSDLYPRAAP